MLPAGFLKVYADFFAWGTRAFENTNKNKRKKVQTGVPESEKERETKD